MTNKAQSSQAPRDRRHGLGFFRKALLGGLACAALGALTTSAAMATDPPQNCKKPAADDPGASAKCLGFGLGVGGFFFTEPDIVSTTIDGGSVRVLEQHQREAALWLEIHNTFFSFKDFGISTNGIKDISVGPFAALQMGGTNGTFSSFAVGGMIYFPTSTSSGATSNPDIVTGFGLGIGYGWTQVHRLGDGIVEDQPLPAGISTVRLKQADIGGLVIMLSTNIPLGN